MQDDEPIVGIGLGTSSCTMAYLDRESVLQSLPNADGALVTPSVVHFREAVAPIVGAPALAQLWRDPERTVRFVRDPAEADPHTPLQVASFLLEALKADAERALGSELRDAVLTVPAHYDGAQRAEIAEAGRLVGWDVLSVINEPVAVAIAAGIDRLDDNRELLFLDLGGGSFDVTVMQLRGTKLSTLAGGCVDGVGGQRFEGRLAHHAAQVFRERHGSDPREVPASCQALHEGCTAALVALSVGEQATITVAHDGRQVEVAVDWASFDLLIFDLLARCEAEVARVLWEADVSRQDIDLLIVGGCTRIPPIRERLSAWASRSPRAGLDPIGAVSQGAALAGVFRHRPRHPVARALRQRMAERARRSREDDED